MYPSKEIARRVALPPTGRPGCNVDPYACRRGAVGLASRGRTVVQRNYCSFLLFYYVILDWWPKAGADGRMLHAGCGVRRSAVYIGLKRPPSGRGLLSTSGQSGRASTSIISTMDPIPPEQPQDPLVWTLVSCVSRSAFGCVLIAVPHRLRTPSMMVILPILRYVFRHFVRDGSDWKESCVLIQ